MVPGCFCSTSPPQASTAKAWPGSAKRSRACATKACTVLMSTHARNESLDLATRADLARGGRVEHDSGPGGDPAPALAALRAEA